MVEARRAPRLRPLPFPALGRPGAGKWIRRGRLGTRQGPGGGEGKRAGGRWLGERPTWLGSLVVRLARGTLWSFLISGARKNSFLPGLLGELKELIFVQKLPLAGGCQQFLVSSPPMMGAAAALGGLDTPREGVSPVPA